MIRAGRCDKGVGWSLLDFAATVAAAVAGVVNVTGQGVGGVGVMGTC